jgi:hypothetical protein
MPIGSVRMESNPFDSSFSHQEKTLGEHGLSKATSFVRGRGHHIIDDARVLSYPSLSDGDWLPVMPDDNQECGVRSNQAKEFLVIFPGWHSRRFTQTSPVASSRLPNGTVVFRESCSYLKTLQ